MRLNQLTPLILVVGLMLYPQVADASRIVSAKGKPRPATCQQLVAAYPRYQVWQGKFLGSTEDIWDRLVKVGGVFCFLSKRECTDWLYDMQSANDGPIRAIGCRPL